MCKIKYSLLMVCFCLFLAPLAHANTIPEADAIRAILDEAGPSYAERLGIACALHNRGTLKGIYGRARHPSGADWQSGARAWAAAQEGPDVVHGAQYWLSDYDLTHCRPARTAFRFSMIETNYIGSTHFYREKVSTHKNNA